MNSRLAVCFLFLISFSLGTARPANAFEQTIALNGSWSEYDPGAGKQTLSNQSASGYTSTIAAGAVPEIEDMPRAYQNFLPTDVSVVGQKLTATFDVIFHAVPDVNDTAFRFGFGDTSSNQGFVMMVDLGASIGTGQRMRYDSSITEGAAYSPGDYGGFLSGSGTFGSGAGDPLPGAGGGLEDTTTTHTFVATIERVERNVDFSFPPDGIADAVVNGFYNTLSWTNNLTGAQVLFSDISDASFGGLDVDTGLGVWAASIFAENGSINSIDTFGFLLFDEEPFATAGGGGYTISNFNLAYENTLPIPEPSTIFLALGSIGMIRVRRKR